MMSKKIDQASKRFYFGLILSFFYIVKLCFEVSNGISKVHMMFLDQNNVEIQVFRVYKLES